MGCIDHLRVRSTAAVLCDDITKSYHSNAENDDGLFALRRLQRRARGSPRGTAWTQPQGRADGRLERPTDLCLSFCGTGSHQERQLDYKKRENKSEQQKDKSGAVPTRRSTGGFTRNSRAGDIPFSTNSPAAAKVTLRHFLLKHCKLFNVRLDAQLLLEVQRFLRCQCFRYHIPQPATRCQ